jgi:hypothetical protein
LIAGEKIYEDSGDKTGFLAKAESYAAKFGGIESPHQLLNEVEKELNA